MANSDKNVQYPKRVNFYNNKNTLRCSKAGDGSYDVLKTHSHQLKLQKKLILHFMIQKLGKINKISPKTLFLDICIIKEENNGGILHIMLYGTHTKKIIRKKSIFLS